MYRVKKRNGRVIDFNLSKISNAITKAFEAKQKPYNQDIIDMLALKVTADFMDKVADGIISVEDIQDSVETVLTRQVTPTLPKRTFCTASSTKTCVKPRKPFWTTKRWWTTTSKLPTGVLRKIPR